MTASKKKPATYRDYGFGLFINSMTALCIKASESKTDDLRHIVENIVFDFETVIIEMLPKTKAGAEALEVFQYNAEKMMIRYLPGSKYLSVNTRKKSV